MSDLAALERLLEGAWSPETCPTEAAFHSLWHARGLDDMDPPHMAVAGGALADRPAWAFTAGYQATLRNAFALPPGGWAAFAATEDADDPEAHPGTTLREGPDGTLLLDGCKAWVGHSRSVRHLLVSVNDPHGDKRRARAVLVPSDAQGVHLSHRASPAFLPALSQGYARFESVRVGPEAVVDFGPIGLFGRTEAKFVMLACAAFMFVRAPAGSSLPDGLLSVAAALLALIGEAQTSRQAYGAIDREFQRLADQFEREADTNAIADWAGDARLLRMYTARIQRRVGYARDELERTRGAK